MTFEEFCDLKSNDPKENIFPKGTEPYEAMDILEESLLDKDYKSYDSYSDIVRAILSIYKKKSKTIIKSNLSAQEAIDLLKEELLGKDWYVEYPCRYAQFNTEVVGEILYKYCKVRKNKVNQIIEFLKKLFK